MKCKQRIITSHVINLELLQIIREIKRVNDLKSLFIKTDVYCLIALSNIIFYECILNFILNSLFKHLFTLFFPSFL